MLWPHSEAGLSALRLASTPAMRKVFATLFVRNSEAIAVVGAADALALAIALRRRRGLRKALCKLRLGAASPARHPSVTTTSTTAEGYRKIEGISPDWHYLMGAKSGFSYRTNLATMQTAIEVQERK